MKYVYLALVISVATKPLFAGTTGEQACVATAMVMSALSLAYAITATVLGSMEQSPKYQECRPQDPLSKDDLSIVYCGAVTNGTRMCSDTQDANKTTMYCSAPWLNPKWAQNFQASGLILLPLSLGALIGSAVWIRSVFSS